MAENKIRLLDPKNDRSKKQLLHFNLKDRRVTDELVIALANRYDAVYNGSNDEEEINLSWKRSGAISGRCILPSGRKSR